MKIPCFLLLSLFIAAECPAVGNPHYQGHLIHGCDNVPGLNKKIIAYVDSQIGKKVDRGECWDLAASALNKVEATWDKDFVFGKEINISKDCVYPGDIIQFTGVTIEYKEGNRQFTEEMAQHTAIIYKVNGAGDYTVAEQNTTRHGRKVGLSALNLKNITKGTFQVYRPVK